MAKTIVFDKTMINITLPDGSVKQYPEGVTALEVAKGLSEGLARNVLAAKVDEEVWDATRPINKDCHLTLLTWQDEDGRAAFWHSTAHLAAEAIEQLYPGAKFGIGPHIDTGFYYDIDFGDNEISSDDFAKIEERVMKLAAEKQPFVRKDVLLHQRHVHRFVPRAAYPGYLFYQGFQADFDCRGLLARG